MYIVQGISGMYCTLILPSTQVKVMQSVRAYIRITMNVMGAVVYDFVTKPDVFIVIFKNS